MEALNVCGVDIGTLSIAIVCIRGRRKIVGAHEVEIAKDGKVPTVTRIIAAQNLVAAAIRNMKDEGADCYVYVERPFGGMNLNVTIKLAQVQAAAMLGACNAVGGGLVNEITAPEWKKAVVGKGNANKEMIAKYCKKQGLKFKSQDLKDAYCMAEAGYAEIKRAFKKYG